MRITVAALTHRRPQTLGVLLDAFTRVIPPAGIELRFLVVDNDAAASARAQVTAAATRLPLDYVVEPQPGVAAARNRALQVAVAGRADYLCFVDDDAYPAPDWLVALDACRRERPAVLTFGPVRFVPAPTTNPWRRFVGASIAARGRFLERYSARRARHGQTVTSGTGNWMGDVRWLADHGIGFDSSFAHGGEDAALREAVRARGGTFAFCPHAVVFESLPVERMTVRYQFDRGRAHGRQTARLGRRPHFVLVRHPLGRLLVGLLLTVIPLLGLASFALGIHQIGMAAGLSERR